MCRSEEPLDVKNRCAQPYLAQRPPLVNIYCEQTPKEASPLDTPATI